MRRAFRPILVAAAALMPVGAAAQEPVTVDAAVQAAIAHNASLRAARAGLDEAAARATEVRAGLYPRLSVSDAWQRGDQPVFVFSSLLSSRTFTASNFAIDALNHPDAIGFFHTSVGVEQGRAISLMAGEVASLLLSRMTVPITYYLTHRHRRVDDATPLAAA